MQPLVRTTPNGQAGSVCGCLRQNFSFGSKQYFSDFVRAHPVAYDV